MLLKDGIPSIEQVKDCFPEEAALTKPKAIIECYEEIPCNPCETSCPFKAITIGADINKIPQIDHNVCTGCRICVHSCPGLAIMIAQIKDDQAIFRIPYELLPLPVEGETWEGVDRSGGVISPVKILKVDQSKRQDRTAIVHVAIDKKLLYDFITIRCPYE